MFTIAPPVSCLSICSTAYLSQRKTPVRLVAIMVSQSAMDTSWGAPTRPIPEFATITSSRPKASTVFATRFLMSSSLVTSARTKIAFPPAFVISSTTRAPSVSFRPETTTEPPSRAMSFAHASPMPLVDPVTIQTLLSSLPIFVLLNACPDRGAVSPARLPAEKRSRSPPHKRSVYRSSLRLRLIYRGRVPASGRYFYPERQTCAIGPDQGDVRP